MAAVKKAQTEDKGVAPPSSGKATVVGMVTVVVGPGPIHHGGQRCAPGDRLVVSEDVAVVLVSAGLATRAKGGG